MYQISTSEHKILSVAEALFGFSSPETVTSILQTKNKTVKKFGPTSARILHDIVSKGLVLTLCKNGGWKNTKRIWNGSVVTARLWDKKPINLACSENTVKILFWLVEEPFKTPKEVSDLKINNLTLGDRLVLALSLELLINCNINYVSNLHAEEILCWLLQYAVLCKIKEIEKSLEKDIEELCSEGTLLESLQLTLAKRWLDVEVSKSSIVKPEEMIRLGSTQEFLLGNIIKYSRRYNRPDLIWFIVKVLGAWAVNSPTNRFINLDKKYTLSERQNALTQACAVFSTVNQISSWVEYAKSVKFFDEDYAICQALIQVWESFGSVQQCNLLREINNLIENVKSSFGNQQEDEKRA
jgi:hypothetical protein